MTEAEFFRWYWLRDELAGFARQLGLSTAGGKVELASRIAARLSGRDAPAPSPRRSGVQLTGALHRETVIPPGQRSSQVLRQFFEAEVGPAFHFTGPLREFIAAGAGRTLGEAIDHWASTRNDPTEIAEQFEYNRFTRRWHAKNPGGSSEQLREEWWEYRSAPRSSLAEGERDLAET